MQIGAEIRQSVANVDTDLLLNKNWPLNTSWELQKLLRIQFCNHGLKSTGMDCKIRMDYHGILKFRGSRKSLARSTMVCVHCIVSFTSKSVVLASPPVCGGRSLCRALEVLVMTSVVSPAPSFHS